MQANHSCWPRFEIFVRSRNGLEHKHSSSLHATDAEHALMLARDVYTRRQEGISLWVLPANSIFESEEGQGPALPLATPSVADPSFEVFIQMKPGLDHKHAGTVRATSLSEAFTRATLAFGSYPAGAVWVAPSSAVQALAPEAREAFFEPMADKIFRLPTFYELPAAVDHM